MTSNGCWAGNRFVNRTKAIWEANPGRLSLRRHGSELFQVLRGQGGLGDGTARASSARGPLDWPWEGVPANERLPTQNVGDLPRAGCGPDSAPPTHLTYQSPIYPTP